VLVACAPASLSELHRDEACLEGVFVNYTPILLYTRTYTTGVSLSRPRSLTLSRSIVFTHAGAHDVCMERMPVCMIMKMCSKYIIFTQMFTCI
jgi:hypothetical protein